MSTRVYKCPGCGKPIAGQNPLALHYLRVHGFLTTAMWHEFGFGWRLSARIKDLQDEGHVIHSKMVDGIARYDHAESVEEPNPWKRDKPKPVVLAFSIVDPAARVALAAAFDYSDRLAAERKAA